MKRGMTAAAVSLAMAALASPAPSSAEEADPPPDPAVVAQREARASSATNLDQAPAEVADDQVAPPPNLRGLNDLYYLDAKVSTGGYLHLFARDNAIQDHPGILTTTMRIYGHAGAFRHGEGAVSLTSKFTCTAAKVDSFAIGTSSAGISGSIGSKTLTWSSSRASSTEVRQNYTEGGHFRCRAWNAGPAVTTRRGIAGASYKQTDVRAEDSYSFAW